MAVQSGLSVSARAVCGRSTVQLQCWVFYDPVPHCPCVPLSHTGDNCEPEGNVFIKSCTGCRSRARQLGTESWPSEAGLLEMQLCQALEVWVSLGLSVSFQTHQAVTQLWEKLLSL